MTLKNLLLRIEQEEDNIRAEVLDKANAEVESINKKVSSEINDEIQKLIDKTTAQENNLKINSEIQLELEERKQILSAKREILSTLYKKIEDYLLSMTIQDYHKWLLKRMDNSKLDFSKQNVVLEIGIINKNITEDFIKQIKNELEKKNSAKDLKVMINKKIKCGFVFKLDDIEINSTLEVIIDNLKEKEELNVSKMLFV